MDSLYNYLNQLTIPEDSPPSLGWTGHSPIKRPTPPGTPPIRPHWGCLLLLLSWLALPQPNLWAQACPSGGTDITVTGSTAKLPAAPPGSHWRSNGGNTATIDDQGNITGLTADGNYSFLLVTSGTTCGAPNTLTEGIYSDYFSAAFGGQFAIVGNPIPGQGYPITSFGTLADASTKAEPGLYGPNADNTLIFQIADRTIHYANGANTYASGTTYKMTVSYNPVTDLLTYAINNQLLSFHPKAVNVNWPTGNFMSATMLYLSSSAVGQKVEITNIKLNGTLLQHNSLVAENAVSVLDVSGYDYYNGYTITADVTYTYSGTPAPGDLFFDYKFGQTSGCSSGDNGCVDEVIVTKSTPACVEPSVGTPLVTLASCTAGGTSANADGSIVVPVLTNASSYGFTTDGSTPVYTPTQSITGGVVSLTGLANPVSPTTYSIRVFNGSASCFTDVTALLTPRICTPVCALATTATPGSCNPATNQYLMSGTISLTNAVAGTATITDGSSTTTVSIAAGAPAVTYSLAGLTSGTGSHTVTVSLPGCGTAMATYSAPASCTVAATIAVTSATICYNTTATLIASGCSGSVSWNTGESGTSLTTPALTSTTAYTATCTTSTGSTATAVGVVTVMPQAVLTLSASSTLVTVGNPVSLSAVGCTGSVVWSTGETASVINVTPTQSTQTYSATCTTGPGCTTTASLVVNTIPAASLVVTSVTVCYGQSATLIASGCSGSVSWNTGESGTSLTTPALTSTTAYTATCTTSTGSTATAVGVVTVMPQAVLTLSASSTLVTVGNPVSLSAVGCTGSVVWSTGETASVINVTPTQSTQTYSATCTTGPGCTTTASLVVNTVPAASLVVTSVTVCYGQSATLIASGCSGSVSWNTGESGTSLTTPALTSTTAYTATCTTSTGSTATAVGVVTVMPQAQLSLSASSTLVTVGNPVSLSAVGCTGSVVWSTGETASVINVTPTQSTQTYSATCTTGPGCTTTASLVVNTIPAASLVVTSVTVCYGQSATLIASGCSGSVSWNTGASGTSLTTPALTSTTAYTATCTTSTGSTATAVGVVTVMPQAQLSLSASSTLVTVGNPVSLSAVGCTGSVVWSTGETASVINVTPTQSTQTYSATCTTGPGCRATASITIRTTAACSVSLTTTSLPTGTVGQAYSTTLTASGGTAPYSFSLVSGMLPAGLTLSNTGVISGIPAATGSFSTTIRISDSQSCSVTVPLAVLNIQLGPVCSLSAVATPGSCSSATNTYSVSGTLNLTNNTAGGTILLSDGAAQLSLSVASGVSSVPYSLTGLLSDGLVHTITATLSGCGTASVSYTAPASCTYTCAPPVHVCKGSNYAIRLSTTDGQSSYQWYRDGVAIQGATTSSYTATQAGSYSVVVNGNVVGQCPNGSCCPVVIVEDSVALYQANAQAPTCNTATTSANSDGRILVSNWKLNSGDPTTYYYQVSSGSSFNAGQVIAGGVSVVVPSDGVLVANLANPGSVNGQSYTVRITNGLGCYRDVVVNLAQTKCVCPPAKCVPFIVKRIR